MEFSLKYSKEKVIVDDNYVSVILLHNPTPNFRLDNEDNGGVVFWSNLLNRNIRLARLLLGKIEDDFFDAEHKDRNKLNNRISNLRWASRSDNLCNRAKFGHNNTSKYKCVSWSTDKQKWAVYVHKNKHRTFGGYFYDEIEAARKADELMKQLHGEFAVLNFPPNVTTQ